MNGSALAVNWASKNAYAILDAWYAGEEGGTAIGETLAGANKPAGRLPVTFYTGADQVPAFEEYAMQDRTYRYFAGRPLFAFGHGLSYTKFAYSNLKLSDTTLKAGDPLEVGVDVRNSGSQAGDEVAQLYLRFPETSDGPRIALRGFVRIHLSPGETKNVQFKLSARDLSAVDANGDLAVEAGNYHLSVGGGQPGDIATIVEKTFTVEGRQALPE